MVETKIGRVSTVPIGPYNPNIEYKRLDLVNYKGSGYVVKKDCVGIIPTNKDYYMLLAEKGDIGLTPNIRIGEITTLEPAQQANVTIGGTAENPILNFSIPKGDNGGATLEELEKINKNTKEIEDARVGYLGKSYDTLEERIDSDINNILAKVNIINYKDTTIRANNTYARNLTANRNKVEILGQTIQNCLDHSSIDKFSSLGGVIDEDGYINIIANGNYKNFFTKLTSGIVKPNTMYTFIIDVKENTLVGEYFLYFGDTMSDGGSVFNSIKKLTPSTGIIKFTIQTTDDFSNCDVLDRAFLKGGTSGSIKFRYAIVEGDWTNKEVSFVPFGLNFPENTKLKMAGLNCLDHSNADKFSMLNGTIDEDGYINIEANGGERKFLPKLTSLTLKPSTMYTFVIDVKECSFDNKKYSIGFGNSWPNSYQASLFTSSYALPELSVGIHKFTLTTKSDFSDSKIGDRGVVNEKATSGSIKFRYAIIEGDWTNKEIPELFYKFNSIIINKPLLGINDAVRDRVYLSDGKVYHEQNINEIIFDGSDDENWTVTESNLQPINSNYIRFYNKITNCKFGGSILCDKLKSHIGGSSSEEDCIWAHTTTSNRIDICIEKNKLNTADINGIKQFLKNNNLKVQYQLTTPIITELTDIGDFYSYEEQTNWYTTNTIKPTINVDVPSDLNAVVSTLMTENSTLKNENKVLSAELELTNNAVEQHQANIDYISMMTEVQL